MKTLVINAHPGYTNHEHFSVQLQDKFIELYHTHYPEKDLTIMNLYEEDIPRIEATSLWSVWEKQATGKELSSTESKIAERSQFLLEQFKAHQRVVVSTPLHNFNITSRMKDYIDNLMIARETFRYLTEPDEQGKVSEGLMRANYKMLMLFASGSVYTADSIYKSVDIAPHYMQTIFQEMMGFDDFQLVRAEGTATQDKDRILNTAFTDIEQKFSSFYQ
ncbi:FMN-dependent NADH-azoreductase [Lactococcus garvieae]|uniref:FMN-dependent NADH-azoreductase n=1 Tax=Lactococcus formosensis TaxID=1281486 RepID=UPI0013FE2101|nr:NAD(P)H-dependent oxidoreductase [Lactococcus formosensis]NHI74303.1 FMN-dependent NADH-azoreductase [Lactococcus garvieae]NHJ00396.1 FMN-dependent NADH-azoreductase [Lactococcus garvieae]NHJ19234.1 FMN-dependent NADH-azoreductase [Lactococcus garvieae]